MNILTYEINQAIFVDSDGENRSGFLAETLGRLWTRFAGYYLARQRRKLPPRTMMYLLRAGEKKIVKQWYYDHVVSCSDSAGYFTVALEGDSVVVSSFCENCHPGPSAEDCLFIDGVPLGRNETRKVSREAEILLIDYADKHRSIDDWEKSVVKLLVAELPQPAPDQGPKRRRRRA